MEDKYTSLELSKKLKKGGCLLKANSVWGNYREGQGYDGNLVHCKYNLTNILNPHEKFKYYPAYDILNDICCKYVEKFFGVLAVHDRETGVSSEAYYVHSKRVLSLMQQGKKQEAEEYIWNHCVFNKKGE